MRLVTTVHGWVHHTGRTPLYYLVDRLSLRHYEKVICVSDDLITACRQAGVPSRRCALLENGIDLNDYQRRRTPAEARAHLGFAPQRFTIGAAGRLSAEKGFDVLLRAVDRLLAEGHDVQLLLAGEGVEFDNLQRLAHDLNRGDRLQLLGYRADLTALYEAMDVYALSSYREGLPNVLLEAMAMQTPVVATRINGVPRLIEDEVSGLLVAPGSVDQLAERLRSLLQHAHLRDQLAHAARSVIETRYSFAHRMDKLARMYDTMFHVHSGGRS
jgi:glycosyltransferase involved in cell wall biosynthesis